MARSPSLPQPRPRPAPRPPAPFVLREAINPEVREIRNFVAALNRWGDSITGRSRRALQADIDRHIERLQQGDRVDD